MSDRDDGVLGTPPSYPLERATFRTNMSLGTPRQEPRAGAKAGPVASMVGASSPSRACGDVGQPTTRRIVMEHSDEYEGEVFVQGGAPMPHGHGTLLSRSGRHCYIGEFSHRWRDGYGKLVTERYVLWGRWRMNRPDLRTSCRVDYPNGDKYSGFLELLPDAALTQALGSSGGASQGRMSKFSAWVQTTAPVRCRWGEWMTASGDRYFGEWRNSEPHGFGCYIARNGDRYVGRFRQGRFHDTGTLFSLSFAHNGVQRLPKGALTGSDEGSPRAASGEAGTGAASGALCVLDGVWSDGRFLGEGHTTLPGGVRVSADWSGAARPAEGEVVWPTHPSRANGVGKAGTVTGLADGATRWAERFHWEPLLCGAYEEQRAKEREAAQALRDRLSQATRAAAAAGGNSGGVRASVQALKGLLLEFLTSSQQLRTALRVFRRCFFFLYGTCGRSGELGGGQGGNPLGWCTQREPFGGCLHPGRGRPIVPADLDNALTDIHSFVCSTLRWTAVMLGAENLEQLDLLDVSVDLTVGRWVVDAILHDAHDALLNLYRHVYAKEVTEVAAALERFHGRATLDDMGVDFARHQREERLFDPYADAVHCIEQLSAPGVVTLSAKLAVLSQWSRDIDLSTRLVQAGATSPRAAPGEGSATASGSADDLLPIHQYVLSQARVPLLYAHTRMVADFAEMPLCVDSTSREAFGVTNLLVCVATLPRLHVGLHDANGVLVPVSFLEERLQLAVAQIASAARTEVPPNVDAKDLACVALGYLANWLPEALAALAAAPRPLPCVIGLDSTADGVLPIHVQQAAALRLTTGSSEDDGSFRDSAACRTRLFCWRVAGSILATLGIAWGLNSASSRETVIPLTLADPVPNGELCVDCISGTRAPCLCVPPDILPSILVFAKDVLASLLQCHAP